MSSASAAVGLRLRDLAGRMLRAADPLPPGFPPLANAHSRTAAAVAVLAMAAAALIVALQRPAAMTAAATVDNVTERRFNVTERRLPAGPVRIVGATPRGDNCSEQVWPYIEQRCLARADRPNEKAAASGQPVARITTGAAAADPEVPPRTAARSRVATANLALPPQRFPGSERVGGRAWQDVEAGSDGAEGIVLGEPQRRSGRRAHRHRPRSFFPFPF